MTVRTHRDEKERARRFREHRRIFREYLAAEEAGDDEKSMRIGLQIPIPPGIANIAKRYYGIKFLIDGGFNLSDAVNAYGKDWLDE